MNVTFGYALLPVIADIGIGGPALVVVGGVVVIIAILLVFVMVLRSNGGARKTSSGIGYDAHQGPYGQSRAPSSQPNRGRQGPASAPWADDYPSQRGPASRPGPGAPAAASDWSSFGGFGGPAAAASGRGGSEWPSQGSSAWGGGQPASSPQWGAQPDTGNQSPWGASPAAQQRSNWNDPAPRSDWGQPDQQQGWNAPPAAPRGWDQPPAQPGGQNWNNVPASSAAPGSQDWGAPAPAAGLSRPDFGGGNFAEEQRTFVVRPQSIQGEPKLVVSEGKEPGRNYEIRKDRITIGRSRDSDVFLEDLAVSRTHTSINHQPNGRYLLHDENSANGTLVNGQRVTDHVLEDGDKIQVGQTLLVFVFR